MSRWLTPQMKQWAEERRCTSRSYIYRCELLTGHDGEHLADNARRAWDDAGATAAEPTFYHVGEDGRCDEDCPGDHGDEDES